MSESSPIHEFATALGETEPKPLQDLQRVLDHVGAERMRELVRRTRDLAAQGGMQTCDESRPRTLGGIFFQLAREHVPRTPPPPRKKRLRWQQAAEAAHEAGRDNVTGEAQAVKITLIGRPGKIVKRDTVIITKMHNQKRPALPKQLPKLSGADVETRYTIFIAAKQWRKVEEAIRDKDDALIVEGYPFLDPDVPGICVFAKSTTTKHLQRAKRAAQRALVEG